MGLQAATTTTTTRLLFGSILLLLFLLLFIAAAAATAAIVAITVVIAEEVRLQLGQVLLSAQPAGKVKNDAALERERKVERKREIIR